jgi:hypothetical protein
VDRLVSLAWIVLLAAVVALLALPDGREWFAATTKAHPFLMGAAKFGLLGTMGELLGKKIVAGRWIVRGIRLEQRVLVWCAFGVMFTVVFPLFSFGVEGLLRAGLVPGDGNVWATAFWKSFFMNVIFAFPMQVSHRITDTLIDRRQLFSPSWPLVDVFVSIDWPTMFRVAGAACIWFWIPAHTVTFLLPPEFRLMCAALLAIALGAILGLARRRAAVPAPALAEPA